VHVDVVAPPVGIGSLKCLGYLEVSVVERQRSSWSSRSSSSRHLTRRARRVLGRLHVGSAIEELLCLLGALAIEQLDAIVAAERRGLFFAGPAARGSADSCALNDAILTIAVPGSAIGMLKGPSIGRLSRLLNRMAAWPFPLHTSPTFQPEPA